MPLRSPEDYNKSDIEPIVDGMIGLIQKNLIANTVMTVNALNGTNTLTVENALRFNRNDKILIFDDNSVFAPSENRYEGIRYHIIDTVIQPSTITVKEDLTQDWLTVNNARLQRTVGQLPLFEKDVLFGDRSVIPFDFAAICVEPTRDTSEWVAVRYLGYEYSLDIIVYVVVPGEGNDEDLAHRAVVRYATALKHLLNSNIHLDLVVDEVEISENITAGQDFIKIALADSDSWEATECYYFSIQDNNKIFGGFDIESAVVDGGDLKLTLSRDIAYDFDMSDNLVLRRHMRYLYDSRVSDVDYGVVQKGKYLLKAAKLSWFGKEVQNYHFPQIGKGGDVS